ncbi:hypothetical protein [Shewanella baltica]|uniref:hypothetical protein n=1 Tax=Shewanella baltica TaxID=62322 RepID=UPI003218CFCA
MSNQLIYTKIRYRWSNTISALITAYNGICTMLLITLMFGLSGCQSTVAPAAKASLVLADQPDIPNGQVRIYIFKEKPMLFGSEAWNLEVEDEKLGLLANDTYNILHLWPGEFTVHLKSVSGDYHDNRWSRINIHPNEVGKTYYLELSPYLNIIENNWLNTENGKLEISRRHLTHPPVSIANANLTHRYPKKVIGAADDQGLLHGPGVAFFEEGDINDGKLTATFEHGNATEGVYEYPDGRRFEGKLEHNSPESGTLNYANGEQYIGPVSYIGEPDGDGQCIVQGVSSACRWNWGKNLTNAPKQQPNPDDIGFSNNKRAREAISNFKLIDADMVEQYQDCRSVSRDIIKMQQSARVDREEIDEAMNDLEKELERLVKRAKQMGKARDELLMVVELAKQQPNTINPRQLKDINNLIEEKANTASNRIKNCPKGVDNALTNINETISKHELEEQAWQQRQAANFPSQPQEDFALKLLKQQQTMLASTQQQLDKQLQSQQQADALQAQQQVRTQSQSNPTKPAAVATLPAKTSSNSNEIKVQTTSDTASVNKKSSNTKPMADYLEATAYCVEFKSGGWKCDGPIQKESAKSDSLNESLGYVGCTSPRTHTNFIASGGAEKTQGAVYYCGYGLWRHERDISKFMSIPSNILNQRQSYQCEESEIHRCPRP